VGSTKETFALVLRMAINLAFFCCVAAVAFTVPYPARWLRDVNMNEMIGVAFLLSVWFVPAGVITTIWSARTHEPAVAAFLVAFALIAAYWLAGYPAHGGDPRLIWRSVWPAISGVAVPGAASLAAGLGHCLGLRLTRSDQRETPA
jgi:hypothetical protein